MAKKTKKGDFSDIDNLIKFFKKLEKDLGKDARIGGFVAGKDGVIVDIKKSRKSKKK